ncbi:DUF6910 family protein [Cryptosporangium sp. NPDC048952]|uniref:DUF6910 family protein n=1 Tax=Cryptosporangium sp. NPDC048952 TaxID=3363961 RepID=UPI0037242CEC
MTAVRVVEPVNGLEFFSSAAGTKHVKPDFEAACAVGGEGVLLLGSGSAAGRTRASLVTPSGAFTVADLAPVYRVVADALGVGDGQLNLEGAGLAVTDAVALADGRVVVSAAAATSDGVRLWAVVDADDPETPSIRLALRVLW